MALLFLITDNGRCRCRRYIRTWLNLEQQKRQEQKPKTTTTTSTFAFTTSVPTFNIRDKIQGPF